MGKKRSIVAKFQRTKYIQVLSIVALILCMVAVLLYSFTIGRGAIKRSPQLEHAALSINLEALHAHLWFEELITGDQTIKIDDIWTHIDQAEWYIKAILHGGDSQDIKIAPTQNLAIRHETKQISEIIIKIRSILQKRWNFKSSAQIGSKIDQRTDKLFKDLLNSTKMIHKLIHKEQIRELFKLGIMQSILIIILLLLGGILIIFFNRHQKKQIQNFITLHTSEESLRITLASIGDAVIATDLNGNITRMNIVAEQLTHWSLEDAQGKQLTTIFNIIHAKTRKIAENPVAKVLATGKIVGLANHTVLIAKDGTEYQIADSGSPIKDDQDKIIGIVLIFRDVTDEYQMQEKIINNEKRLQSIFSAAPTGIGIVIDRVIIQANSRICKMTGYLEEELIGKNSQMLYPSTEEYEHVGREKYIQIKKYGTGIVETLWKCKNGNIINILLSSTPMDIEDLSKGVTFTALDITDRKKIEKEKQIIQEQLLHSSKLASIGKLAAGVGHEINNPLAIISGHIDKIKKGLISKNNFTNTLERYFEIQEDSISRISSIVDGLRNYARVDNNDFKPMNIHQEIARTLQLVKSMYEKDDILIQIELNATDQIILGNIGKFQQVLMNLLTNARDAMEEKNIKNITIKTKNKNDMIVISVTDTGCGIPLAIREKIFDPFYTTKEMGKGTGIGLGISFAIVQEFKGNIKIESNLEQGSTFFINIPTVNKMDSTSEYSAHQPSSQLSPLSGFALVVDDEEQIREILIEYLKSMGLEVDEADCGTAALEKIKNKKYDYICTDLKMPKMSGEQFVKKAKKLPYGDTLYFIITGGITNNYSETGIKSLRHLVDGYVQKPFSEESLYQVITEGIKKRKQY